MGESKLLISYNQKNFNRTFRTKAGNITGAGSPAKQRLSEQDIHNLSEYIQTLK